MKSHPVSWEEVRRHIDNTNPHRGMRDFWQHGASRAGTARSLSRLSWTLENVSIDNLPEVFPLSRQDVRRYAQREKKTAKGFPPIVVAVTLDVEVLDGSHRVAAAEYLGYDQITAYVGRDRSRWARAWKGLSRD